MRVTHSLVRFPDWHECQSGERTPPERGILLQRLLAVKKWLEPPHMTHIVGFCSMWTMPGSCQNLGKSIQVVARADLAPPPVCPLFQSVCFNWNSLYLLTDLWPRVISYLSWHVFSFFLLDFFQFVIGFAAKTSFAFATTRGKEKSLSRCLGSYYKLLKIRPECCFLLQNAPMLFISCQYCLGRTVY